MQAPTVDSYSFGSIEIDGEKYRKDCILFPDHVFSSWWRKKGHRLQTEDLEKVFSEGPDLLVIGTGNNGRMEIPDDTRKAIEARGIEMFEAPTAEAVKKYNTEKDSRHVVGAFHLTC